MVCVVRGLFLLINVCSLDAGADGAEDFVGMGTFEGCPVFDG